jgi:hypothetical protein
MAQRGSRVVGRFHFDSVLEVPADTPAVRFYRHFWVLNGKASRKWVVVLVV